MTHPPNFTAPAFITDDDLEARIAYVLGGTGLRCAVAFWGVGAELRIRPASFAGARLICNLTAGGTNPRAIRALWNLDRNVVRHHPRLHAKVYISGRGAVVGSANLSANGLGFEGQAAAHWLEAGMFAPAETAAMTAWFAKLWNEAEPVTEQGLTKAQKLWDQRQKSKPPPPRRRALSLADFDPVEEGWWAAWEGDEDWELRREAVRNQTGREPDEEIGQRIANGTQVTCDEDVNLLKNRWLLMWTPDYDESSRTYLQPRSFRWVRLGDKVFKGSSHNKKGRIDDNLAEAEGFHKQPFDPAEETFGRAFTDILAEPRFERLRVRGYRGPWFAKRNDLNRKFWIALKARYLALAKP